MRFNKNKYITRILIIAVFFFCRQIAFVQVDRLQKIISGDYDDSLKIKANIELAELYSNTDTDTAVHFLVDANELIDKSHEQINKADFYKQISDAYKKIEKYRLAIKYMKKAILFSGRNDGPAIQYRNKLSNLYIITGKYDIALKYLVENLGKIEGLNETKDLANTYSYLGLAYRNLGNLEKAKYYFNQCIDVADTSSEISFYPSAISEIGNILALEGKYKKSLKYLFKAKERRKKHNNKKGLFYSYNDIANTYSLMGEFDKALLYYKKCLSIQMENNPLWANIYVNSNIGIVYREMGSFDTAHIYFDKCLNALDTFYSMPHYQVVYDQLASLYAKEGRFEEALHYYQLSAEYKDSIFDKERLQQVSELETLYESEKKDKEIALLTKNQRIERNIRIFLIIGLVFMLVITFLIFRNLRLKRKANNILIESNEEIKQQKDEILSQSEEIENQRDLLLQQKHEITNSFLYAGRIQKALLPDDATMKKILPPYFVFYRPFNIVSGDFYWVSETKNSTIVAIADCTGHGVPGGFMSTLGIAFLNEMAAKKDFSKPNIILNNLRNAIVHALRQQSIAGTVRDGMDIAILQIMKKSTMIHFAGANMPVYIVRKKANDLNLDKNTVENEDYYLQEIKGDNMPVSIHDKMEDFQLKTIDTQNICDIYFTSDGYADQFGGKHHRKFNKKRFKKLLLDVSGKESNTQYTVIKNKFEEWKGHIQQTDDVLVFGLKPK